MSHTPNTPANGGQILTPARVMEIYDIAITKGGSADNIILNTAWTIEADLRAALATTVSVPKPAVSILTDDELRTYVIMVRPGMTPVVKGPLPDKKWVEDMLRELYQLHADAQCMVIDMPNTSWPQSGIEWIDMYGDKRRKPIRATLAAVPASEPVKQLDEMLILNIAAAFPKMAKDGDLSEIIGFAHAVRTFAAPAPVSGMPDLASLQRFTVAGSQLGFARGPVEMVRFSDIERLLNPTKEPK